MLGPSQQRPCALERSGKTCQSIGGGAEPRPRVVRTIEPRVIHHHRRPYPRTARRLYVAGQVLELGASEAVAARATQRLQVVALPPEYAGVPFTGLAGIVSYRLEMATCFFVLSLGEGPNCERGARPIGDDGVASGSAVVERLGAERVRALKAPDTRFRPGEKGRGRHPLGRLPQISD